MKVGFISLGCSKNLIDTEILIGKFKKNKFEIVNTQEEADIIVINTCGYIESAKEEAINTILEMAEYKKKKCKFLIVMGCLVERYKKELEKALPEVDLFIKFSEYNELWNKIDNLINKNDSNKTEEYNNIQNYIDRVVTTSKPTAYLRIAEGCSNRCTYCAIPYIRGPFISRKMEDIISEAKYLAENGYKELILIAQDTTKYGTDIYGEPKLVDLLNEISKIPQIEWIRFLYSYPETITDELIKVVKENDKICKYFDIPLQHISDLVLKKMNRKSNEEGIRKLLDKIRKNIPETIIRTTFIVGFPGETKEDFEKLYEFVKEEKFDKMGVFKYSKEDGTPAAKLPEQINGNTKNSRYNKIMKLQNKISKEKLEEKIGKEYKVLIENKTFDNRYYVGRSYMDSPEIDGLIFIKNEKENLIGKFINCKIIRIKDDYDLIGKII